MRKRRGEADDSTSFPLTLGYRACLSSTIQRLAVFTDCFPTRARSTTVLIDRFLDGTKRFRKPRKRRIDRGPNKVLVAHDSPRTRTIPQPLIARREPGVPQSLVLAGFHNRHHGDARRLQRALNLCFGAERTIHQLSKHPDCHSEHQTACCCQYKNQSCLGTAFARWGRG